MMMMDNFESANSEEWSMPVLDGSSNTSQKAGSISSEDLAKFPGWGEDVVQRYLSIMVGQLINSQNTTKNS